MVPDDYGKVRVAGGIVALSPQHIAIRRHDPCAGEVVVHFPRAGFMVFPAWRMIRKSVQRFSDKIMRKQKS